ncbi:MAG: hypothetical protein KC496_07365 [Anaerolineae bacterium]|nr:hypothetical protein [Anaerolineae bacterium]
MLSEKPKRDQMRKVRRSRTSRLSPVLGIALAVMMFFPLMRSNAGGMDGEQWVDLALVMVMFCCSIALLYQLALATIDRGMRELSISSQQQNEDSTEHDIFNR